MNTSDPHDVRRHQGASEQRGRSCLFLAGSFVGLITGWEMGVVIESDLWDVLSLKIDEPSVVPTSAAVLRDILHTGAPGAGTVMQRRAHWPRPHWPRPRPAPMDAALLGL